MAVARRPPSSFGDVKAHLRHFHSLLCRSSGQNNARRCAQQAEHRAKHARRAACLRLEASLQFSPPDRQEPPLRQASRFSSSGRLSPAVQLLYAASKLGSEGSRARCGVLSDDDYDYPDGSDSTSKKNGAMAVRLRGARGSLCAAAHRRTGAQARGGAGRGQWLPPSDCWTRFARAGGRVACLSGSRATASRPRTSSEVRRTEVRNERERELSLRILGDGPGPLAPPRGRASARRPFVGASHMVYLECVDSSTSQNDALARSMCSHWRLLTSLRS